MHRSLRGFTLVELMVAVSILALLLGIGVPSVIAYLESSRVRNAALAFHSGLQKARAEAIRSNEAVQFILTDDIPTNANVDALNVSATGRNWAIRVATRPVGSRLIESRLGNEGGGTSVVVNAGAINTLTFDGLGRVNPAVPLPGVRFTHQTMNLACNLNESVRCITVVVSSGGQARLCEPGRAATDGRSC